jgi:hypothetical protein
MPIDCVAGSLIHQYISMGNNAHLLDGSIVPRPEGQGDMWQLLEVIGLHNLEH